MIRDCPENKKPIVKGSKDDNVGTNKSLERKEECLIRLIEIPKLLLM